ncbi:hypothetical protein Tco_0605523 [Tanacetum coccineum]
MDAAIKNQGASIKTLEIQIRQIRKVLLERGFRSLLSSTETNPRDHVKSILTIVEADASSIRRIGSHQYAVSTGQNTYSYGASHIDKSIPQKEKDPGSFTLPCYINNVCFDNALADLGASVSVMPLSTYLNLDFIILDMPEDIKVPLILERPFLSIAHAMIDVFKRNITLRVGEEKIIFKSVKPASSLIKRVYMLSLRERMKPDLEARLMGETLVLNRSLDPLFGDYIELNHLNVPLELRRDQVDDLMPTIEECEVVEEFRARNDARMVSKIFGYPSDCDHDKKIHIDCAHNLKFSCMIDMDFPPRDQRHQYLRYEGLQYTEGDIADFEMRLDKIYMREVHRVQVFDFGGLPDLMDEGLSSRMLMEHRDAQEQSLFTSRSWRRLFDIRGPLVHELILDFFSTFRFGEAVLDLDTARALQFYARQIPDKGDLSAYWIGISSVGIDVASVNVPYLLARYLRLFASGRKQGAMISEGVYICKELDDTWAWVASGPERQPNAVLGAPKAAEDAPVADEGALAVPAPVQAPQSPPPAAGPARTMA